MLFPLFCRNEIRWKTPKLCLNVLKSWHFDPNELNQGNGCFVAIQKSALGPSFTCQTLIADLLLLCSKHLALSEFLGNTLSSSSPPLRNASRCEQQIEATQLTTIMKTIDKFASTMTPFSIQNFMQQQKSSEFSVGAHLVDIHTQRLCQNILDDGGE